MSAPASTAHSAKPARRPYRGSCHCGRMRYIVFLSLPPTAFGDKLKNRPSVHFYKCNCSTCQKMGIFHLSLVDSPNDFFLLSPIDEADLSDYTCFEKRIHWRFCPTCGVRCYAIMGEAEVAEIDLEKALGEESKGVLTKVWKCKAEGWLEDGQVSYFSVNAHTIESGQEGFDLRELGDKKWIGYLDIRDQVGDNRYDYPHEGGTW